jgi:hypothetical protein
MTREDDTLPEPAARMRFRIVPDDAEPEAIVALTIELDGLPFDPDAGRTVVFRDATGAELTRAELTADSGCIDLGPEPVEVAAPATPGAHVWTAQLEDPTLPDGAAPVTADCALSIRAHQASISVWDVPTAIERAKDFRLRVGIKCPHGCASAGWGFTVHDHNGEVCATGAVGQEPWPGTTSMTHAEVGLTAPNATGAFDWTITAHGADHPCPHLPRTVGFRVNSVPQPDHLLRVEVVDAVTGEPVERARVVAHPYRTLTDAQGVAELRLPAGEHTLFVAGKQYFAFKSVGVLTEDTTIRAEMHVDREFSDADAWA